LKLLKDNPKDLFALYRLASIYIDEEQEELALKKLKLITKIDPHFK